MRIFKEIVIAVIIAAAVGAGITVCASETDSILDKLRGDDWQVRILNKAALEKLAGRQSTEALINLIVNRGLNWRIQIRGIQVLSRIHTPRVKDVLVQLFSDPFFHRECPAVKSSLAVALGDFEGPRVVGALIGSLDDPELLVREASIVSLGRVGDASAVPYLIRQLKDGSFTIKSSAIRSLALIKDAGAVPSLRDVADHDRDPLLREEALWALSMIRKKDNSRPYHLQTAR
ncbi:MAG: HEAT repeat domain-containing protein [Candidatus Sulfobium sp.]|jgi:HEAT repeat protein